MLWVRIAIRARCTTLCDRVCHWLPTSLWFSTGTPGSSTNKTDHHDITEMLLEVVLNTIKRANEVNVKVMEQGSWWLKVKKFWKYVFFLTKRHSYIQLVLLLQIQGTIDWRVTLLRNYLNVMICTWVHTRFFSGVCVPWSLVLCVMCCISLFVLLSFFFWLLFDLRILITPLVS